MYNRSIILIFVSMFTLSSAAKTLDPIRIWEATMVSKSDVTLTPFLPQNSDSGIAVIVCPGGSYCWLDYETEGKGVAEWLQANGIAAFVLRYRVSGFWSYFSHDRLLFRKRQYPDMMEDVQRALQIVREKSHEFRIDPEKIGVMGFSAGGHLAVMAGTFFHTNFLATKGINSDVSLRPDFIASIYPVVTMSDNRFVHRRSRRGALGEYRRTKQVWKDSLSMERQVRDDTPPVFLMNCKDDPVVKFQNSELLAAALKEKKIKYKYIQYKTGGHGFGADSRKTSQEAIAWRAEFLAWVNCIFKEIYETGY